MPSFPGYLCPWKVSALLLGFVLNQFQIQNRPLRARQRSELGIKLCGFEGFRDV